jgi:hypothetical protein
MVLSIKLSDGTPNAQIFLLANMQYSALVFDGIIQLHEQLYGICYKQ